MAELWALESWGAQKEPEEWTVGKKDEREEDGGRDERRRAVSGFTMPSADVFVFHQRRSGQ